MTHHPARQPARALTADDLKPPRRDPWADAAQEAADQMNAADAQRAAHQAAETAGIERAADRLIAEARGSVRAAQWLAQTRNVDLGPDRLGALLDAQRRSPAARLDREAERRHASHDEVHSLVAAVRNGGGPDRRAAAARLRALATEAAERLDGVDPDDLVTRWLAD